MNAKLRSSIPVGFLLVSVCAITPALSRPISFEDRVAAQTAIERVYWAHRVWPADNPQPKPPLEAPDFGTGTSMVRTAGLSSVLGYSR